MSTIEFVLASGDVRAVLQPIVDLDSGAVVAYEALARGPVGELERPDLLFAEARRIGRLAELDELCRRAALRAAVDQRVLAPLMLFVNVEPEVLDSAPLDDLVALAADAPGEIQVVMEITERALATRPAELLRTVERVRSLGWKVALDDVGADDMSLAFMPLLRPEVVKLDLRLVQERPGPAIAEIMNAVNAYAERSGAVVLAEGIETERHLAVARALGARLGQGWLLGRPAPGPAAHRPHGELLLPGVPAADWARASPFSCLPATTALRRSAKPLLIELSKHLERQALRLGATTVAVGAFQEARYFTRRPLPDTRPLRARPVSSPPWERGWISSRYAVCAAHPWPPTTRSAASGTSSCCPRTSLPRCSPATSATSATFEFALTYDRDTVVRATQALLGRVAPQIPPPAGRVALPSATREWGFADTLTGRLVRPRTATP